MKKAILSLHILFIFNLAHAQNFLNGNFENTTANCQINTTNNSFNGFMTNCYGFGSDGLDILTNSCGYGTAQNGNYFIAIACHFPIALEAFSLALNSPLISGQTYTLSFWNIKSSSWNPNKLKIGYSADSLSFGTLIDTVPVPGITWTYQSLTFSPINNSSFITVAVADSILSWNYIDNFTLNNITGVNSLDDFQSIIAIYPNPFISNIDVTIQKQSMKYVSITIQNILAQTVFSEQDNLAITRTIDLNGQPNGMYFVVLTIDGKRITRRRLKQ